VPYTDASALALFLPAVQGQSLLTGSSYPTLDQAATYIALISAELDGAALAAGYSVPISASSPGAWLQMTQYTLEGAGGRCLRTLLPHLSSGTNDFSNYASVLDQQYRVALNAIREGKILLVDAPRDGGSERPLARSNFTEDASTAPNLGLEVDWRP
jgi:hypothetical protein